MTIWKALTPLDFRGAARLSAGKPTLKTNFDPMSMISRCSIFVAAAFVWLAASLAPAGAQSSIRVLVNGDIITSYDIAQRTRMLPLFGRKGGEKAATEELIDETLKLQEARKRGVRVSDEQVEGAFASMGKDRKLSAKQLAGELGRIGIAADSMKRWIKAQMIWQRLVQARVRREGQVKSSDIMAAMLEKGSPEEITMTEYLLQQIIFVVPSGSSKDYVAQRRREAEGFRLRFPGCEGSLAQAKTLKGVVVRDYGRRDSTQLRGPQGDEIKSTEPGQTTRPFQSQSGIELVAVCSKRDFKSNAAAFSEVETKLKFEQAEELGKDYLKELRDAAVIQHR
jgi:peptidyl-prolyl cis-trans isomerase SurA